VSTTFSNSPPALTAADFHRISRLAQERFGLNLPPGKESLVASRLGRLIRAGGFSSFADYYRHVISDASGEALTEMIDALTTNYTLFLREPAHFDFLRRVATTQFRREPSLRIWSAACSSGEEPYSIAMALLDVAQGCRWPANLEIIASDISTRVLRKAQAAIYEQERFESVPEHWPRSYLLRGVGKRVGVYKIKPEVARLVRFERLNLMDRLPRRTFHVIFCRNVMIYFDRATQQNLVSRIAECLEPDGYLLIGHSESLSAIDHPLRYLRPATYHKEGRK
jgi:chemotaxis protein methyltransferase CheR